MTDRKTIHLSEPILSSMKYLVPFILIFASLAFYYYVKTDIQFTLIILIVGFIYWFLGILPLKEVDLNYDQLIISDGFKKDSINVANILSISTSSWPTYRTRITFKQPTRFGTKISFATLKSHFYIGVSDDVKDKLENLRKNIKEETQN